MFFNRDSKLLFLTVHLTELDAQLTNCGLIERAPLHYGFMVLYKCLIIIIIIIIMLCDLQLFIQLESLAGCWEGDLDHPFSPSVYLKLEVHGMGCFIIQHGCFYNTINIS